MEGLCIGKCRVLRADYAAAPAPDELKIKTRLWFKKTLGNIYILLLFFNFFTVTNFSARFL